ncbi:hypothetical protein SAMN05519103_09164 [Rhizobiales bacterium GAS113]|nr:hypothetical protein SAMN05519103_09164 [Rhizobiales bacterium GAS113]
MPHYAGRSLVRRFALMSYFSLMSAAALAADLAPVPETPPPAPAELSSGWSFRFIPYGWLTSLNGKQTVRGRTASVDASFPKIVEDTIGKGGTLVGLMGDFEARYGALGLYGDIVWAKVGVSGDSVRTRRFDPTISGSIGTSHSVNVNMAIAEGGAAYEVARFGLPHGDSPAIPTAIDLVAGARYWYQQASLSFNLSTSLDISDLTLVRNRALAKSGSVDWVDPLVGARVRFMVAPGQNIFLRGDVGGFGVGSKISWQAIGGYSFDFAEKNGITYSGIIGFRALYVDYVQGAGRNRYGFDMLEYGPVLGVSMRF